MRLGKTAAHHRRVGGAMARQSGVFHLNAAGPLGSTLFLAIAASNLPCPALQPGPNRGHNHIAIHLNRPPCGTATGFGDLSEPSSDAADAPCSHSAHHAEAGPPAGLRPESSGPGQRAGRQAGNGIQHVRAWGATHALLAAAAAHPPPPPTCLPLLPLMPASALTTHSLLQLERFPHRD